MKKEDDEFEALILPGDIALSNRTRTYTMSGIQYQTKGKEYVIRNVYRSSSGNVIVKIDSDHPEDPEGWNGASPSDFVHIKRDGKIIWYGCERDEEDFSSPQITKV